MAPIVETGAVTVFLPISLHLFIAQNKKTKQWVTQCSCGHEFGDYRKNWKLEAFYKDWVHLPLPEKAN